MSEPRRESGIWPFPRRRICRRMKKMGSRHCSNLLRTLFITRRHRPGYRRCRHQNHKSGPPPGSYTLYNNAHAFLRQLCRCRFSPLTFLRPITVFFTYSSNPRWFKTAMNQDESTGPLARPFIRSLAPLTRLLAPHCLFCSHAPLRSFIRSLARSLTPELVGK